MPRTSITFIILAIVGTCLLAVHTNLNQQNGGKTPSNALAMRRRAVTINAIARDPVDPLPLCAGDCDDDDDCATGLICYQRESTESIPGCEFPDNGQQFNGMDICVEDPDFNPPSIQPTISSAPTMAPQPTAAPTPIASNSWTQTWGMTEAFQFLGPPSTPAPTTKQEKEEDWSWIFDFTQPQPLEHVGNNGDGPFPLGPCQSDCDKDQDCAGPLTCFQRNGGEAVPGCSGGDDSNEDFCVWPEGYNATEMQEEMEEMTIPSKWENGFCLKLYWEEGYDWQNETIERKWCISRDYDGIDGTGKCWYGLDQIDCDPNELYIDRCDHDEERQRFSFIPVSSDEVLIQSTRMDGELEDRCFTRDNRKINLQSCNEALHNQRWFAIRGGFNDRRFELSQKTLADHCISQDHHPKYAELLRMHNCEKARGPKHLTSWWNIY